MIVFPCVIYGQDVARDEKLWQRALQIHRRAIVVDTHNDVTTPMTNNYYDLSGPPPCFMRSMLVR